MNHTVDLKKITLLFIRKIKSILFCVFAGMVLFATVYLLQRVVFSEGDFYRVSSDYYITFDLVKYPNGVDYYNAYTWDSILRDDPIIDVVMEQLDETYKKDEVKETLSGEMLGDYRILSVYVTAKDPEKAKEIAKALDFSLQNFPKKIDMILSIEAWSSEGCQKVKEDNKLLNVVALGGICGLIIGIFFFLFNCILDDSVYVEDDYYAVCTAPFLGFMTKNKNPLCIQELRCNMQEFLDYEKNYIVTAGNVSSHLPGNVYQELKEVNQKLGKYLPINEETLAELKKADGIVLMLPWGKAGLRILKKTNSFLEKHHCRSAGVIFYEAEDRFLQKYYGIKKEKQNSSSRERKE